MNSANILMLTGGAWHDFDGFAASLTPCLTQAGFAVRASQNLDDLTSLEASGCGIVVLYTCLGDETTQCHTDSQTEGLCRWVNDGGSLLAIHSATVAARRHANLKALLGGSFISHPPRASFVAAPIKDAHPIVQGLESFSVEDELYVHDVESSVQVHLVARHQGQWHPLAWSRVQGDGKVVYFALGHDEASWNLAAYQRIVLQSVGWLLTR